MKKAFDQTVRDLKRGVNKNVLKVPRVEQKILDATSNEPWGPHGSLLADIAQATRNYHEYQMIMNVIWKRINDTGKNWRHVYKALTVLDYLVAHGSERVIDDIREHSYQIGTLADFQYIDSSGRDQGQNVRRKSQSLVSLVNNKERIQEVRQKAAANREKYRSSFSTGNGNRAGSYPGPGGYGDRYDDDRYGDQNGYGRERERDYYRDEERYGRGGSDPYSRDGREYEDNYNGRESSYRDKDDSRNSNYSDGYSYGGASRGRNSFDRDRDRPYDDDDRYSTRSAGGGRADDSHDDRRIERKLSEPNIASASSPPAPPSYEDAVKDSPLPSHEERDGENGPAEVAPKAELNPPPASISVPVSIPAPVTTPNPAAAPVQTQDSETLSTQSSIPVDGFDEFDPRGTFSAVPIGAASAPAPATSAVSSLEMDLFGSDPIGSLALVSMTTTTTTDDHPASMNSPFEANSFASMSTPAPASSPFDQVGSNPFGDAPFKALPQDDYFGIPATVPPVTASGSSSFQTLNAEPTSAPAAPAPALPPRMESVPSFNFGDAFGDMSFNSTPSGIGDVLDAAQFLPTAAGVPTATSSAPAPGPTVQSHLAPASTPFGSLQQNKFTPEGGVLQTNQFTTEVPNPAFSVQYQQGYLAPHAPTTAAAFVNPSVPFQAAQPQPTSTFMNQTPVPSGSNFGMLSQPANQSTLLSFESSASQNGVKKQSQPASQPQSAPQSGKFETKSSVWADTLSRGLVNLNISGPKINPHADIGVDFDTMNRKEKREEKKSAAPTVVSTVTMGKAMGTGSGIGRAGAGGIAPPRNSMAGAGMSGMGMGMGMSMGVAGSGGGYGGMNQPMGMGGMGGGMGMGGMGAGIGMGGGPQGMPMRPMGGMQPGAPGMGYNPMMGPGTGFGSQQPYGSGGFR